MSFKDLHLRKGYRSTKDDILNEFYIPVLSEAMRYDRIAGYFSSASLSVAARGIAGLIRNNGHMRLITSPELTDSDYNFFKDYYNGDSTCLNQVFLRHLDDLEELLHQDHLSALCWLLEQGKLEIKIAIPTSCDEIDVSGLFHIKTGILCDMDGDTLTFSGSINETASAWRKNREEFKVFLASDTESTEFCRIDEDNFESLWSGMEKDVRVIDLPDSVKKELIIRSPSNIEEVLDRMGRVSKPMAKKSQTPYERLSLFDNQEEAVSYWFANDHRGIFEMATGTGKTRTATGCLVRCIDNNVLSLVVVSAPQNTILTQWEKLISSLKLNGYNGIICDSSNPNWTSKIIDHLVTITLNQDSFLVVYTTHRTLASAGICEVVTQYKLPKACMLICDEVHGIGAKKSIDALINAYEYRLGLSATPSRWFDDYGTQVIFNFFSKIVYSFPISRALTEINPATNKPYLVHYSYHPIFVSLTIEEIEEYQSITAKIVKQYQMSSALEDKGSYLEMLAFKRANVYKKAVGKLEALSDLVSTIEVTNTIIYTCDMHLEQVLKILSSYGIRSHPFTENEETHPSKEYGGISQREHIIKGFVDGDYHALTAIKCLDEGIDIPSAKQAIIMTSNGNPREYIQRIGRIIRPDQGKRSAVIYDFIVKPDCSKLSGDLAVVEKKIFEKELIRAAEIAKNAINSMDVYNRLFE